MTLERGEGALVIASTAPDWRIKLDLKQGGVATELNIPAQGPNLAGVRGGFSGLFNLFAIEYEKGNPRYGEEGIAAKTLIKNHGIADASRVLSEGPGEVVVEVRGTRPAGG